MMCEICGCTDDAACVDPVTRRPCAWIAEGLCSACEFAPLAWSAPELPRPLAPPILLDIGPRGAWRLRALTAAEAAHIASLPPGSL
jgi:hypothetical protein